MTAGQSTMYQTTNNVVSNQNFNVRGSLPPNVTSPQFIGTPQHSIISQNQNIQQTRQINNYQQQNQVGQFVSHQQPIRIPQHMPPSLIPGQKIQSQTLFQPIDFIQNGQPRL